MKHIKNKLVRSGHTAEEADLLVNNMYYLIRILIENLDSLDKDNDFNKFLPEILNIFKDLPSHWTSLNKESQRSFNNLIFPEGISFSLHEKITTPLISSPFNVYSKDIKEEGNLVELRGFEPLTSTLPV